MKFNANPFELFGEDWGLLTAGNEKHYNAMTIAWGALGTLWTTPVATVYVNPARYTHEFMEDSDYFTISFYDEKYREALTILGTLSGRDGDKITPSGLTPRILENAVTFEETKVTLLCKKIYRQDLDLAEIPEEVIKNNYKREKPHTMYIGEVIDIME